MSFRCMRLRNKPRGSSPVFAQRHCCKQLCSNDGIVQEFDHSHALFTATQTERESLPTESNTRAQPAIWIYWEWHAWCFFHDTKLLLDRETFNFKFIILHESIGLWKLNTQQSFKNLLTSSSWAYLTGTPTIKTEENKSVASSQPRLCSE